MKHAVSTFGVFFHVQSHDYPEPILKVEDKKSSEGEDIVITDLGNNQIKNDDAEYVGFRDVAGSENRDFAQDDRLDYGPGILQADDFLSVARQTYPNEFDEV
jgi:hypothetical protein